jgi:hypothetical protein
VATNVNIVGPKWIVYADSVHKVIENIPAADRPGNSIGRQRRLVSSSAGLEVEEMLVKRVDANHDALGAGVTMWGQDHRSSAR